MYNSIVPYFPTYIEVKRTATNTRHFMSVKSVRDFHLVCMEKLRTYTKA